MSYGSGGSDLEQRVLNLERQLGSPRLASVEQRVGAVEQQQFQTSNPGVAGLGVVRVTASASIASGSSGNATLDDGTTVTVAVWLSGTWGSGKKGYAATSGGQLELISADC